MNTIRCLWNLFINHCCYDVTLQLILTFVSLLCFIITARLHPYEDAWSNLIETVILLDLLLIAGYFLNDHSSHIVVSKFEDAFAIILLLIPFTYGVLYIITSIIRKIWLEHVLCYLYLSIVCV